MNKEDVVTVTKYLLIALTLALLTACKSTSELNSVKQVESLINKVKHKPQDITGIVEQTKRSKKAIKNDLVAIQALFQQLGIKVGKKWGQEETTLPGTKRYVKYSNGYQARAIVDFDQGKVTVETIAKQQTIAKLKQAVITTLLTPIDPRDNDIFSDQAPKLGGEPFLYQQVVDQDSKAIRYRWRANRFAEYLVKDKLTSRNSAGRQIYQVQFSLVNDHQKFRKLQYSQYVLAAAKRYNITPELIYAIIETESSFNPYAVSAANAYGLMQVVPSTAGRDVYAKIKRKAGQPTKQQLFNPAQNIDIGTAYLHILQRYYLAKIQHWQNKEYAMISAYNGGAGNVLNTFSKDRSQAFSKINKLKPAALYWALTTRHPRTESRNYLKKVTTKKRKY